MQDILVKVPALSVTFINPLSQLLGNLHSQCGSSGTAKQLMVEVSIANSSILVSAGHPNWDITEKVIKDLPYLLHVNDGEVYVVGSFSFRLNISQDKGVKDNWGAADHLFIIGGIK